MDGLAAFIGKRVKLTDKDGKEYVGSIDQLYSGGDSPEGESIDFYLDNKPFKPVELYTRDIVGCEMILGK